MERKLRNIQEPITPCSIWGWSGSADVILDIYTIDESLLGDILFAWRDEMCQVVIIKSNLHMYTISVISKDASQLLIDKPIEYLQTELLDGLVNEFKIRTEIIESYKQILKNEIISD